MAKKMVKKVLIVAAHPDDEILGCGGTAARMVNEGHEAYTLILGEGITSRDTGRQRDKREAEIKKLKEEIHEANRIIGVKEVAAYDFPDNRFDSVPLLDIVKKVEEVKNRIQPDIIFTHYANDLNVDHRVTFQAVMTATRPMPGETVRDIYSFEVLSSTEWQYPLSFSPDCFFDISSTIDTKTKAMEIYRGELRDYPHPRSIKGIRLTAETWGMKTGLGFAEAFKTVRSIK